MAEITFIRVEPSLCFERVAIMPSAKDCILAKAKAGRIDPKKAARPGQMYDQFEAEACATMGPGAATEEAARHTMAREAGYSPLGTAPVAVALQTTG